MRAPATAQRILPPRDGAANARTFSPGIRSLSQSFPVCTAASLHIDIACDNAGPQEVLFPPDILPDVLQCDFQLQEGSRLTIPTQPGLGVTFNAEAAKDFPAEMTDPPHYHRPDGSFTNY